MKLVILDANSLGGRLDLSVFKAFGELTIFGFTAPEEVADRIHDVDVIITNKVALGAHNLSETDHLKLICITGTGTNNVDKRYTNSRAITVCNVVNYSTESVAQHTFALLFYLLEHLSYYDEYVTSGGYIEDKTYGHFKQNYNELYGKTWGIIGLGNIGSRVAQIAQVFGCKVQYYSTSGQNSSQIYKRVDLETLLQTSDIVSIHAPLNEQTEHLITYNELGMMKKSSYLLNLGRGKILHEEDLVRAIEEELIAGVGLDVLEVEPMESTSPFRRLRDNKKLYMTPHIAWASVEARNRVVAEVYQNIESYFKGEPRCVISI